MKKTKDFCLRLMCCFLFLGLFCGTEVFAAVQEGKPGETFSGKYAVIINTDTTNPGNTGTLQFDGTSAQASDSEAEDYAVVQGGSNASAQAATEGTAGEAADVGQVQSLEDDQLQAYMQDDQPMLTAVQAAATTYQVGEKKYIYRTNGHDTYGKTYVCIGVGEHCYVWMDETLKADYDTAGKTSLIAADMAAVYDGQPYRILNQLCAGDFPAQDGSGKLSILLESLSSASGMYMYDEGITAIHINTPSASSYVSGEMSKRNGLLVHEGQHAILWLKTGFMSTGRYSWLNEGLAVAVMDYLWGGTDSSGWLNGIGSNTAIRSGASLIYENYRDDNAQDYGMPYLFVRYVIDRMAGSYQPMKVLPKFYTIDASSLSCEQYLEKVTGVSFKELMADFYTAVVAGESSGKYSFYGDTIAAAKAATFPVYAGDSNENHTLPAASAILVKLSNGKFTVPTDGSAGIVYRIIGSRSASLAPAEGDGTSANPYKISSIDDLNLIQANQGAYYRLTKNISTDGRTNFSASYFSGTLDGAGFTITGLQKPLIQQNAGTIKDLNIVADFDYDSHDIHGVVAQYNTGKIQDCKVTGTVTGHMGSTSSMSHPAFGGIVGENEVAGTISGCSSGVNISISMTATDSYVGGIAGVNIGTIEKCVAGGNLSVTQANGNSYQVYLGGIAGRIEQFGNMGGYVKQCAFTGTLRVTGGTAVTGQICAQVNANVLNSAIGLNGHVSDCYGKNGQGALIGTNTEQTLTTGGVLTAEQMKNPNSYKGWSFDGDWQISKDGLPERADASAIRSLSVSGVPTKCYVGEVPAYWGRLIVNNSTSVTITKDMIAGFENSETGTRELTINYKGKQTSWSMTVEKPSASDITSIVLSGHPKTTYSENQKFDPSGASFFATIGGRYVYIYSGFSYDKTGPLKSEDTSVIFNYFGKEIPVSITVTARKAKKLSVLAAPAKTQFTVGNTLDLSGVKLQITYNDGTQTPIFKADELEKYGVHVAFGKNGSFTTVAADKVLESDDSGSTIVFYATDKLPSEYGSVVVASSTITVRSPLTVPALDLYVSAGKSAAQYPCTDNVTGGSGTYATTVIEEKLPAGLTRTNLPGEKYNAFGYTGVVTASARDYSSQYKISDTETQESIQVTVTIHVVPSDQAAFYSFVLKKVENPGLKQDVIGAIGEDTIVLRVPKGTNVTKLKPSIDYGSGMGTGLSSDFWNGSTHDFTSPVVYTLTAPDGVTKKSYTVSVEFYDDTSEEVQFGDEILSPADNTKISCKDSDEVIFKGWAGDSSKEISLFKYVVNGISYTTSANATTQTIPNARAYEVKISGSSLKEGNNTLEIWVMYADNSGTGSGGTLKKLGTRTVVKEGHKAVKDAAVAATCETTGKTEGSHCSVCNTVIKAQTTTAALGHSWDSGKVTKAATCTAAGTKTYTCTRCKKTRTETIAATGHKAVKDAAVAATCETAGKTEGSHCSVCGIVIKAQTTIAALGHSWDSGKVTKAATCTTAGTKTYTCTRCKKTRTETIAATGHKVVKDAAVAATCETVGKTEGSHCSVCGTVLKSQTTTAALGHSWDSGKVTKAATCTAAGTKTYTCTHCKKTRTETIAATGHKVVKDAAVAATCETTGKTEGSHCSVCNTVIKAQTTTAALGHSWDGGKVTKAATCTTAGTKTYTCTRCKKTRTETIAAAGHKAVKDAAVAATCETTGKTEGSHCSVCGTVLKSQTTIAALGHDYGEWKTIKAATYTEPGQAERVCRRNASHKEYRQLPILEKAKIDLSACSIQLSEQTYVYDGTEKTPTVTITYNEKTLTEGKDYQVYFADNVNPGTAKITVIAKTDSDYTGTTTITFEIRRSLPENATVIEPGAFSNCTNLVDLNIKENVTEIGDNAFADSKNLQNIYFYGNSPKLGNNIFKNVTATVYYPYTDKTWSLDILRDYGGNITWVPWDPKTGSPAKRSLALCDIRIAEQKYTYDGTEKTPEMVIMDGNYTLQKNTDYTVKCSNNTNAGNAELEITGAGNYSGIYKAGFLIEQTAPSLKFDKKTITVKYGTKPFLCVLSEKTTDGTITYSSSNPKVAVVDPTTGKVTIKGGGTAAIMAYAAKGTNYTSGSTFCTIKVTKRSNTIKASNIRRTWYAKARKISINAKASGKAPLKYSSSSKSVKVDKQGRITIAAKFTGSARITIRSSATAGYNAATKSITVTVNPAGITLTTAKNLSGRKAQITWKKNRYVTGYEIQYSVNKNFRSGSKKTLSGVSKTKYTLTKLQKNKTYYVRIRTYKKSGTKKYYSSWSKVKAVRIRK
ncbi:leucine-rich repeat protein [Blautia sp. MSK20_18]|uniref:leucine-rich repeat protein n=1 Tax=Blautia sp. MSK20_18 TaxID=2883186 RepID=UPI0022387959|nr:leucine-rich repeat protein [Blautia sp. MSK20_18]MCB7507365.1 leucine-rich repeat protein [Blautia sp. MSK20_18]